MPAPESIHNLIETFERNIASYKSGNYNETQVRLEFINPFFEALGWDVRNTSGYAEAYKDVIHEYSQKTTDSVEAPDYCFRIGGTRKFFIEAKKPSVNLKDDIHPAFQLRRYAWSAKLPLSVLTDFEELAVYDCRIPPKKNDKASTARVMYFHYKDYLEKWDEIESIFSREAILKGSFDKFAETNKSKRGTAEVDDTFLKVIEEWREFLARNIALRNENLSTRELNYAVQKTIDRIIFLRICEDRGIEEYGQLLNLLNGANVYQRMIQIFTRADEKYNSGLFHFEIEKSRAESPDELTPHLEIDDKVLKEIIKHLYYPESPFEFSVLPADILGQVYEQFLGKVIRLTDGHRAIIEDKPEVKKAGGVYYTPTYIVKYIVENTLGKLLTQPTSSPSPKGRTKEGLNTPKGVSKIKVLDPACGSGSFLLEAYQYLLDWHLKYYTFDVETLRWSVSNKNPVLYQAANGEYRLTTGERKRILLNNIYGVDIDSQAVEVTKLSLLLKVLEGESDESLSSQLKMFHERALPDLGENIKCGNSLIGPDFYDDLFSNNVGANGNSPLQGKSELTDDERLRINVFDWKNEFKEIMSNGGFDVVIGNPPYVRQELISIHKDYFQEKYFVFDNMADLYSYFMEKGIKLLNDKGWFCYIVSNKWMRANYGEKLREFLRGYNIQQIIDFGDLAVFKNATTYPCIIVLNREEKSVYTNVTEIKNLDFFDLQEVVNKQSYKTDMTNYSKEGWYLSNKETLKLILKLGQNSTRFGDIVKKKIYRGIITGLDKAFILDEKTKNEIVNEDRNSEKIIKPYIIGRDVQRYSVPLSNRYLIYIPNGWTKNNSGNSINKWQWFRNNYPTIAKHLTPFEEVAKKRWDKGEYWWELRPCDYYDKLEMPKLVYLKFQVKPQFTIDISGQIVNSAVWFIPGTNEFLLGILNSKLGWFFINTYCTKIQSGYQLIYKYLEKIPIKDSDENLRSKIITIVKYMIELNTNLLKVKTPQEKTALQRQIAATDKQIDQLVYQLYGLTEEEIRIVEGE